MNPEKSQTSSPKAEDVQKEQSENDCSTEQASSNSRKAALSKREIMEQLSRERFPWDE